MIDLGLTKLAVIGAVALVVIGPEKLPTVARMAGTLYGRAQRYLRDVKSEVSRELEMEELRNLHQDVLGRASGLKADVVNFTSDVERTVSAQVGELGVGWSGDMLPALPAPPVLLMPLTVEHKAREFRRKKLVRTSSVPAWFKNRQGTRQHVRSGAARLRTSRPGVKPSTSFF